MDLNFDEIDFSKLQIKSDDKKEKVVEKYDKTTMETYRIKRLLKVCPLSDNEVPVHLRFEYEHRWDPISGEIIEKDEVGPLCFNAITLYDYIFTNRFKGLWNPATDGYEGYYGDLIGLGNKLEIKSRGSNPEKYLFRLPIIDCYLHPEHNYSIITMGPILSDDDIKKIDDVVTKYHKNKNFLTTLSKLKELYDNAICDEPNSKEYEDFKEKNKNLSEYELKEKFNRMCVDKLVRSKY